MLPFVMFQRPLAILLVILLGLTGLTSTQAQPGSSSILMGEIRFQPLQQLIGKVVSVGRKVDPTGQSQQLPFILGMMLGDPTLASISPTDNISAFVYFDVATQEPSFLIVAKFDEGSPALANLQNNMGMTVQNLGGWSFISRNPAIFREAGDLRDLVTRNTQPLNSDIAARVYMDSVMPFAQQAKQGAMVKLSEEIAANSDLAALAEYQPTVDAVLDIVLGEMNVLDWAEYRLTLSEEKIRSVLVGKAEAGSPMGTFFSAPAGGPAPVGDLLGGGAAITGLGKMNYPAVMEYYNHLLSQLAAVGNPELTQLATSASAAMAKTFGQLDGSSAMLMDFVAGEDAPIPVMQAVYGGTLDAAGEKAYLDGSEEVINATMDLIVPLVSVVMPQDNSDFDPESIREFYAVERNVAEVEGLPVHRMGFTDAFYEVISANEEMAQAFGTKEANQYYYARVDGQMAMASTVPLLTDLVGKIRTAPVTNNLNEQYQSYEGVQFQARVDFARLMATVAATDDDPELQQMAAMLQTRTISPMYLALSSGSDQLLYTFDIPMDMIEFFVEMGMAAQAGPQPQPTQPAP